jgi:flagellar export protein FliJ
MARFRLASVLRARQVQEDAARGAVVRARAEAEAAEVQAADRAEQLAGYTAQLSGNPRAFIASLCARQSLAAEISATQALAAQARGVVGERLTEFTAASIRRAGVEKLAERHAAATRAAEEAAAQRELDDLASTRRRS